MSDEQHRFEGVGSVSRETFARLQSLANGIEKWNPSINLVSKTSIADIWNRHILDSLQIYKLAPSQFGHWVDLGSGGGFPGLVVAIMGLELNPDSHFTLVEADQRKATFLREMTRMLSLRARIVAERIETVPPLGGDVISARALAPLSGLLLYAERHAKPEAVYLFPKGRTYLQEVEGAKAKFRFNCEIVPNALESDAGILKVWEVERV